SWNLVYKDCSAILPFALPLVTVYNTKGTGCFRDVGERRVQAPGEDSRQGPRRGKENCGCALGYQGCRRQLCRQHRLQARPRPASEGRLPLRGSDTAGREGAPGPRLAGATSVVLQ